jgi:hypothetical protein
MGIVGAFDVLKCGVQRNDYQLGRASGGLDSILSTKGRPVRFCKFVNIESEGATILRDARDGIPGPSCGMKHLAAERKGQSVLARAP